MSLTAVGSEAEAEMVCARLLAQPERREAAPLTVATGAAT
jgi:hypothetical protein